MNTNFYSPAPYPEDEFRRQRMVQALLGQSLTALGVQPVVDRATAIFGTRYAAMTLLDNDRQWIAVSTGLNVSVMPRATAFCGHTILSHEPLVVQDTSADERFAGNPLVVGPMHIHFYAGAPLMILGAAVGALCVLHDRPLGAVHRSQVDALCALASTLVERLEAEISPGDVDSLHGATVTPSDSHSNGGSYDA